jgi:nucleotide-binding universal stress UspA family protein
VEAFAPCRILAGTDFSNPSTWALRHAVTWAQRYHADLVVLHAVDFPVIDGGPHFGSYNLAGILETAKLAAEQQLAEYVPQHVPLDVRVTRKLVVGSPAGMIEECAAAEGADLVVLGTHGWAGLTRFLMGSVAERTLRMARHPTLIVRQLTGREGPGADAPSLRHVLCPVNYTEVARAAFEHAVSVARTFDARLTVLFAVEPGEAGLTAAILQRAEENLRSWLPADGLEEYQMQPVVRHGNAEEQVIGLARESAVDLIVLGAQHRRVFVDTVDGVTTVRVSRHAPSPLLVVTRASEG